MAYFAGIDGGGSKTICLVGDEHRLLGRGIASSSKPARVGLQAAQAALREAVDSACRAAQILPGQIEHTCLGLAGASVPETANALKAFLVRLTGGAVQVLGDMVVAFEAAFGEGAGVIVISGTGSICYGRNPQGEISRAGGLAPPQGDEGSGEWIGRLAVALGLAKQNPKSDFAAVCPAIIQSAEAGDAKAADLLSEAGAELANLAAKVIDKLWDAKQPVAVRLAGGILQNSSHVQKAFQHALHQTHPSAEIALQTTEPAFGALSRARKSVLQKASVLSPS